MSYQTMETIYKEKAKQARLKVLEMIYRGQSSHIGSNFSVIDILTVLFDKADLSKDQIMLSAGWKAASFYYFLAEKGIIPKEELDTYCQKGSRLIGLTEPGVPGVLFAGGSMQMGLPAAVGFALAKKMKGEEGKVYCIMSDGELAGGMVYESALIAKQHKLDNLVVYIDGNKLQAMGETNQILETNISVFNGWDYHIGMKGHRHFDLDRYFDFQVKDDAPRVIYCNTTKGKGVSFMENNNLYHYKNLSEEEYLLAKDELNENIS